MAYADQPTMSPRKAVSIGLVILLHVVIGYAFITGLAFNVIKKAAQDLKVVDVKDQPPPPEQKPPPPPPQQEVPPPPMVTPPPIVQTTTVAPPMVMVPVAPAPVIITPTAPPAPPAPVVSQAAAAKGDPQSWVTTDDYPPGALREERQGVSTIGWTINEQGRVEGCHVIAPSGSPDLDDAACRLVTRRGRYAPAKDQAGNPIKTTTSKKFRWQIPAQ